LPHGKGRKTNIDGNTEEGYFFKGEYAGKNEKDMTIAAEKIKSHADDDFNLD